MLVLPDEHQASKLKQGLLLPLMEAFYTIQGEGYHTGTPAYFIRIGGCDVGCHWCDVKESWDATLHPLTPTEQIIQNALPYPAKTVVITGGEPTLYQLEPLTHGLKNQHIQTHLETSGAYPVSGIWDWICLSPKKTIPPLPENFVKANELKVIIHNKNDFEWAEKNAQLLYNSGNNQYKKFLQPEWSKRHELMPLVIDYVMQRPEWNISLQTHKYMGIP